MFDDRRVRAVADGYDIEHTTAPARYHAVEMYAMGKRQPSEVPDFSVFSDQAQFSPDTAASPFLVGESVTVTGRVAATDPVDFNQSGVGFYKADNSPIVIFYGEVKRSGDFAVSVRFNDSQRGQYAMAVYLYWKDSGTQYPRSSASTITVECRHGEGRGSDRRKSSAWAR